MQFDNLFGYEEQQQQQQQSLIQPQQVEDVNELLFKQQKNSQILSSNSKRNKKQNNKWNLFKQQMTLIPKSKSKIQKKNQITGQIPINYQGIQLPITLFKIKESSKQLKDILSKVNQILKIQYLAFNENKQLTQNENQNFEYLSNCLVSCLNQFKQIESIFPDLVIKKQIDQTNQSLKLIQDDNIFLDCKVLLPEIKFSEIYKNEFIKLHKFRISASSKLYGCAICEQSLCKTDISKFAFKINKIDGNIAIGVCNKDILVQQNYQYNNFNNTQGLYLLQNYGGIYPHQEKEVIQGQPFEFQQSNIIIVIVNFQKQYIKWKKYNHESEFSINFDINNDLYPCVVFSKLPSFKKISQVTIIKPKTLKIIDGSSIFGNN